MNINSEVLDNCKLLSCLSLMIMVAASDNRPAIYKTFCNSIDLIDLLSVFLAFWQQQWQKIGVDGRVIFYRYYSCDGKKIFESRKFVQHFQNMVELWTLLMYVFHGSIYLKCYMLQTFIKFLFSFHVHSGEIYFYHYLINLFREQTHFQ